MNDRAFGSIDLHPTLAALAGVTLREGDTDGKNVWPLMRGAEGARNPHRHYFISTGWDLEAVMSSDRQWKLHLPHGYRDVVRPGHDGGRGETRTSMIEESLFNLFDDPTEQNNLITRHPDIAKELRRAGADYLKRFASSSR